MNFRGIPVIRDSLVPLTRTNKDGTRSPALCWVIRRLKVTSLMPLSIGDKNQPAPTEPVILVHPDRWDAFWMAVNQPDVFAHPEVRALLVPDAQGGVP